MWRVSVASVLENTGHGVQRGAQKGLAKNSLSNRRVRQPLERTVASRVAHGGEVG